MTAHDPRVTLTDVLAAHVRLPMMHSQGCSCGWHASLSHPDLHRTHLAERIEEHIAARLAPIWALADEWRELAGSHSWNEHWRAAWRSCAGQVEHALDAPVSASQDHDGAEGQGEVHNHPPYEPTCNERRVDGQLRGACLNNDGSPR